MRKVAECLKNMPISGIREIMDLAAERQETFHLELGEPGFPTPAHIQEAAFQAIRDGYTKYTPNAGLPSLRQAIQRKLAAENGIEAGLEQIAVTPGAIFASASALMTVAEAGDEILIPDPFWPDYHMLTVILGLKAVFYKLRAENDFQPDLAELDRLISPRTRALVINSPSNPTGSVFPREMIESLLELAVRHDIYLISDEVYERIILEGEHHSPAALDPDGRVIAIYAASKTYAMTGWRLGWYLAPRQIAPEMNKLLEPFVASASSVSQKAAEAALSGPQDCVREMVAAYVRRRDMALSLLEAGGVRFNRPRGAFYLIADISPTGLGSYAFARQLLQATGVAVAPGLTFGPGSDHLIRLSFCAEDEELREGVNRFCRFYQGLVKRIAA